MVGAEGLSGPDQARRVRAGADGEPITDGVFPETKEFLAGYNRLGGRRRQIQAAIAAVHDTAPSTAATDWAQILTLYSVLLRFTDSPMARVSRAIALAMVEGPAVGLAALDELAGDPHVASSHRLDAARAHLLERAGQHQEAIHAYRRAAQRTTSIPERNYLLLHAAQLSESLQQPDGHRDAGVIDRNGVTSWIGAPVGETGATDQVACVGKLD